MNPMSEISQMSCALFYLRVEESIWGEAGWIFACERVGGCAPLLSR